MSDKVKLEIFPVNMCTRWICHATGKSTEKTDLVVEVTEGEAKAFRVGDECLRRQNVQAEMMEHADRLEKRVAKLRDLAPRLIVPTWREYQLAELREAVKQAEETWQELGRLHADRTQLRNPFADYARGFIAYAGEDNVLSCDEILKAFGVTEDDLKAEQRQRDAEQAEMKTADLPF